MQIRADMVSRLEKCCGAVPGSMLHIRVAFQDITLFGNRAPVANYPVSTSRYGIGNQNGSFKTPPGIHRIAEKIGGGAPPGRIFRDRIDTLQNWTGEKGGENLILTRILWLEGLEEGINRGPGIDSRERYIYIHGTNNENAVSAPMSHGCVCMRNADIIDLFDRVKVGTIVVID